MDVQKKRRWMDGWRVNCSGGVEYQVLPLSQIVSDGRFVKPLPFIEELSDFLRGVTEQLVLHQERNTLRTHKHTHTEFTTHHHSPFIY